MTTEEAFPDELIRKLPLIPDLPLFPEISSELLSTEFDAGFVVRPGDTLLLSTPAQMSHDQVQMIRDVLRERLPKLADVIVLAGGLQVTAVYRDDDKDEDHE